jgi:hypothetical protein
MKSNGGFRFEPKDKTWYRWLNDEAFEAADRVNSIQPITGEKPTELQKAAQAEPSAPLPKETAKTAPPTNTKTAQPINPKAVADYMQKVYTAIDSAEQHMSQGQAEFKAAINRLNAFEKMPDEHKEIKALFINAAESPDLPTLKERLNTINNNFIKEYKTDLTAPDGKTDSAKNAAAVDTKAKAGNVVNLADAAPKNRQAAQDKTEPPTGTTGARQTARRTAKPKPGIGATLAAKKAEVVKKSETAKSADKTKKPEREGK